MVDLLKKSKQKMGNGLIEGILTLYDYPRSLENPTRNDPISAENPCFSLIGATTYEKFETALSTDDLSGGVANRFEYYVADASKVACIPIPSPPDAKLLSNVAEKVNSLRRRFDDGTPFTFDAEATESFSEWYIANRAEVQAEENTFVRDALGRADLQLMKNCLIHAVLRWKVGMPHNITGRDFEWAVNLQEYLKRTVRNIYSNFASSAQRDVEERILASLRKHGASTMRELNHRIRKYSRQELEKAMNTMINSREVGSVTTSQTTKYAVPLL